MHKSVYRNPLLIKLFNLLLFFFTILICFWFQIYCSDFPIKNVLTAWLIVFSAVCLLFKVDFLHFLYAFFSFVLIFITQKILLLICWEFLAILGIIIVWRQIPSRVAIYSSFHVLSGILILASLALENFAQFNNFNLSQCFLFLGILINCAIFPFSFWLSKTYPKLEIDSLLILGSFTTKAAMIVLFQLVLKYFEFSNQIYNPSWWSILLLAIPVISVFFSENLLSILCYLLIFKLSTAFLSFNADYAFYVLSKSILYQSLLFISCFYSGFDHQKIFANKKLTNLAFFIGFLAASGLPNLRFQSDKLFDSVDILNLVILIRVGVIYFQNSKFGIEEMKWNEKAILLFLSFMTILLILWPHMQKLPQMIDMHNYLRFLLVNIGNVITSILIFMVISFIKHIAQKISFDNILHHQINTLKNIILSKKECHFLSKDKIYPIFVNFNTKEKFILYLNDLHNLHITIGMAIVISILLINYLL